MAYKLLSKEYYKDKEKYNDLYYTRYNSESTVHLPLFIKDNPSFFVMNNDIAYNLAEIYKCCDTVKNLFHELPPAAKSSFINNTLIEEISVTNEIEGVSSTRQEIEYAIEQDLNPQKKNLEIRFEGIVNKYGKIINQEKIKLISCEDIRELYDEFVLDEIDKHDYPDGTIFRKDSVSVMAPTQKTKHQGVYPEVLIIENMQKALDFLNDDAVKINKVIKIAIFHYYFGYIHPFYDGNGRLSRFISSYLLNEELELFAAIRLSYAIKNQIKKYYNSFDICNDSKNKGDLTSFIYTFIMFILQAYNKLENKLIDSQTMLTFYWNKIQSTSLVDDYKKVIFILIQNAMFDEASGLSIKELSKELGISDTKTRRLVKELSNIDFLITGKDGHKNTYTVSLDEIENLLLLQTIS